MSLFLLYYAKNLTFVLRVAECLRRLLEIQASILCLFLEERMKANGFYFSTELVHTKGSSWKPHQVTSTNIWNLYLAVYVGNQIKPWFLLLRKNGGYWVNN